MKMGICCVDVNNKKLLISYHVDGQNYYTPHTKYLDQVMSIVVNQAPYVYRRA